MHPVLAKELEQTQRRADCFDELVDALKEARYDLARLGQDVSFFDAALAKAEGVSE